MDYFFFLFWRQPIFFGQEILWPWLFLKLVKSPFPLEEEDLQFILIETIQMTPDWEKPLEETWQFKKNNSSRNFNIEEWKEDSSF